MVRISLPTQFFVLSLLHGDCMSGGSSISESCTTSGATSDDDTRRPVAASMESAGVGDASMESAASATRAASGSSTPSYAVTHEQRVRHERPAAKGETRASRGVRQAVIKKASAYER